MTRLGAAHIGMRRTWFMKCVAAVPPAVAHWGGVEPDIATSCVAIVTRR